MRNAIYHLRCNNCQRAYLSVPGDLRGVCFTCDQVDWQLVEVFLRPRTPWVDAPGTTPRLFPVQTAAGFLRGLAYAVTSQDMQANVQRVRFVVPGLSHQVTWHHAPWCRAHAERCAPCDPQCREVVTYARVGAAPN